MKKIKWRFLARFYFCHWLGRLIKLIHLAEILNAPATAHKRTIEVSLRHFIYLCVYSKVFSCSMLQSQVWFWPQWYSFFFFYSARNKCKCKISWSKDEILFMCTICVCHMKATSRIEYHGTQCTCTRNIHQIEGK